MAQEFARKASGNFTVQFELVCQTSSLAKAMQAGGANVWFVPISYRGQSCYRVFWGRFPTREAAMAAWVKIPSSIRGAKPVVVAVPKS
jgi:septal ring-binding cell division protein DamX